MPLYEYLCNHCNNQFEKRVSFSIAKPVGEADSEISCPKCDTSGAVRQMATNIKGWNTDAEPWEYEYTHKVKPKFVKDSEGNRHKFDPTKHSKGRKGSG